MFLVPCLSGLLWTEIVSEPMYMLCRIPFYSWPRAFEKLLRRRRGKHRGGRAKSGSISQAWLGRQSEFINLCSDVLLCNSAFIETTRAFNLTKQAFKAVDPSLPMNLLAIKFSDYLLQFCNANFSMIRCLLKSYQVLMKTKTHVKSHSRCHLRCGWL